MSDTPAAGEPTVTVLAKIPKLPDLETHLCELQFPSPWKVTVFELRDYVPSTGQYGLGYWLPVETTRDLRDALVRYDEWLT